MTLHIIYYFINFYIILKSPKIFNFSYNPYIIILSKAVFQMIFVLLPLNQIKNL